MLRSVVSTKRVVEVRALVRPALLYLVVSLVGMLPAAEPGPRTASVPNARVSDSLVAYYPLDEGAGRTARDQSGNGAPLDLALSDGVTWLGGRTGVQIPKKERLLSPQAGKVYDAVQQSGQISIEVWAKAGNLTQGGPARIVSYSYDAYNRNFTLGQQREDLQVRFRTTTKSKSNLNGYPYLTVEKTMTTEAAHYLITYDGSLLSLYKDGQLVKAEPRSGALSSWNRDYYLVIGDEFNVPRPWIGEVYLVALYSRALSPQEVGRNYQVGPDLTNGGVPVANQAPAVDAGSDQTVLLPMSSASLYGSVTDDGLPNGSVSLEWSKVSGPGAVSFNQPGSADTNATFSEPGTYVLQLIAADGDTQSSDEISVNVTQSPRVSDSLVAFYPFNEGRGTIAADQSGNGPPLNLTLSGGANWLPGGNGVAIPKHGKLASDVATKIRAAAMASGEITVEVWAKAGNITQGGPARLVTYSLDGYNRNFSLAQQREETHLRFRVSSKQVNGWPYLIQEGGFDTALAHHVFTFDGSSLSLYKDGQLVKSEARIADFSQWDPTHFLVIGNEYSDRRPWAGEVYMTAIYNRALTSPEIDRNFRVGANLSGGGANISNAAPQVNAGPDQIITLPGTSTTLDGLVSDDGLPNGAVATAWTLVSGPGSAEFSDDGDPAAGVTFDQPGTYTLQLSATDGDQTGFDQVVVNVSDSDRVSRGLIAYYPMTESGGTVVNDQSGFGDPLDLQVIDEVQWLPNGNGVSIHKRNGKLESAAAAKLHQAITNSGQFSFEAWAKPANVTQSGPARLLSYSHDAYNRNFTLGQAKTEAEIRLRTTASDKNGKPYLEDPIGFSTAVQHYLVTFDGSTLSLYRDGQLVMSEARSGDLSNWDPSYTFVLGNESQSRRTWEGEIYMAAVYDRALSQPEVSRNHTVGYQLLDGGNAVANAAPQVSAGPDRDTTLPRDTLTLGAIAVDDGLPSDTLTVQWSHLSGPMAAGFVDASVLNTAVIFPAAGEYRLQLSVTDGQFTTTDEVLVRVVSAGVPRLLEQATWGPTPADMERLQAIGPEQFLQDQFNAQPSDIPDFSSSSPTPVQAQLFYNAIDGEDQLRQRMAFALSQILVVSGNTVGRSYQLVPYLRILQKHALGNYRELLEEMALSPTMGRFLDNVSNGADLTGSNPPNENFARESLQLMTIGTCLLNLDGTCQTDSSGNPSPAYSEDTVLALTRALTGWTYPTRPDRTPRWPNRSYYVGPMIPFEEHHDQGEKVLMNGFTIPPGQTAREDLEMALDHLFNHPNVGPFISKNLIQHLVTSNPSNQYVADVAAVFNGNGGSPRGDLQAVVRAILLHREAQQPSAATGGRLREPVLFATTILRNLEATVPIENRLRDWTRRMGQDLLFPPSVFSYFSPFYRIPGVGVLGPEFQIHTISNALNRANFVYRVVRNRVGRGVSLDLSRFVALVDEPGSLVAEIDLTLFHGRMPDEVGSAILKALAVGGRAETLAQNALYIALTSSAYQVQQ